MEVAKESDKVDKLEYASDKEAAKLEDSDTSLQLIQDEPRLKSIKWKVDLRLSAICALLYCVNQIDRNNLPNA